MATSERTSQRVASKASGVLSNPSASKAAKSLAGSALSQAGSKKQTSGRVAALAGKVLDNSYSAKSTKSLAASVLTQANKKFPVKSFQIHGSSLTKSERVTAVRKSAAKK